MDELQEMVRQADRAVSRIPLPDDGFEQLTRVRARRRRNQRITAAGVGLVIGLAAIVTATSILRTSENPVAGQTPPVSAPPSAIAFGRVVGGSSTAEQVFLERPDGTTVQLTHGPDSNEPAAWSPDGSQVMVVRTFADGSGTDLFAVHADGSSETRLTRDRQREADAQWSPDGSRIAFRAGGGIRVMNADGTDVRRLAARTSDLSDTFSWAPDGAHIAFISAGRHGSEIDVADADGTHIRTLRSPTPPFAYTQLAWSPDGSTIALLVGSGHSTNISLMDADGKHLVPLSSIQAGRPVWSPDGSKISIEGADGVYVIDVADGTTDHVTGSGTGAVSWSPDGSTIGIFDGGDIVVMNANGTDRIRLAGTGAQERSPMWQPSGSA